jgi:hypothetical protein
MSSVAPVPEVFQRLFLATDAPMGKTWLLSTRIQLMELALHRQALASKVPLVAKARDAYGYFRTASQMNKVPGWYWKPEPDLSTSIQQHSKLLSPQPVPTFLACLIRLSSEAVDGILLVTQQFAPDGTKTERYYITVVAAPSLATSGTGTKTIHQGYRCRIAGTIRCLHCLVSQPAPTSTAPSWRQRRAYLAKSNSLVSWTSCKIRSPFSFLLGS